MTSNEPPKEPQPEPLRFFGTTWLDHTDGYAARRAALALGSLLGAVAGAFLLRLAYQGLAIAQVGGWINIMIVLAFAVCSSLAFSRTLTGFTRSPEEAAADRTPESSMRSIKAIGFIGVLLAYAWRCVIEAPGEKQHRRAYEEAVARHERLRSSRTGNPARSKAKKKNKKR
ncbi:hypothetical protein [Streptomyces sp. ODS28]|uniref:hypothetical protein n=1 Tax=Streptomyces sp. ODS28 TaxID=3136688 RepID=UPI0031E9BB25